jgi:hypothetical protein
MLIIYEKNDLWIVPLSIPNFSFAFVLSQQRHVVLTHSQYLRIKSEKKNHSVFVCKYD